MDKNNPNVVAFKAKEKPEIPPQLMFMLSVYINQEGEYIVEMELLVYYTAEGKVVLEAGENALVMHRAEAEALFVDLGMTLQDMDISQYEKESGNGQNQP